MPGAKEDNTRTQEQNSVTMPYEPDFQRPWREPLGARRISIASAGSLVYHILLVAILLLMPGRPAMVVTPALESLRRAVPLYIPEDLTQRDRNNGPISHSLDVRSAAPPVPRPQAPRFRAPVPRPAAAPAPLPNIEAPVLETAAAQPPPPPSPGRLPEIAPPPDRPKLAFESVGAEGTGTRISAAPGARIPRPTNGTDLNSLSGISPPSGAGTMIGDPDDAATGGTAPSNGPVRSNLQLLSDPQGVDFKPYLIQILTAVRTNWLAVIPESARMGRRGRVLVQFIVDRRGRMPKIVIAEESGTAAFDRAAVAGVNASVPFPPLPRGYKGDEVRLQLAFSYNMASR